MLIPIAVRRMLLTYLIFTAIITGLLADGDKRFFNENKDNDLQNIRPEIQPQFSFLLQENDTNETIQHNSLTDNQHQNITDKINTETYYTINKMAINKLINSINSLTATINNFKETFKINKQLNVIDRYKRDVNDTDAFTEATDDIATVLPLNVTDNNNDSRIDCLKINESRRSMNSQTDLIKEKLLLYLEEGFHDVEDKVVTLEDLKRQFANVVPYKIGYIVANIDTLAVNVKNLREDVRMSSQMWGEKEILDVYDRLKTSNSLIAKLLDTLKMFNEKGFE